MAGKPQDMLLLAANVFAGVFDFLEDVEKGETPLTAATRAVKKSKKRAKALRKGMEETAEAAGMFGDAKRRRSAEPIIEVVEKTPLFSLCACGCGLPKGQCQGRSAGGKQ